MCCGLHLDSSCHEIAHLMACFSENQALAKLQILADVQKCGIAKVVRSHSYMGGAIRQIFTRWPSALHLPLGLLGGETPRVRAHQGAMRAFMQPTATAIYSPGRVTHGRRDVITAVVRKHDGSLLLVKRSEKVNTGRGCSMCSGIKLMQFIPVPL